MAIALRATVSPVLTTGTLSVTTSIASTAYLSGDLVLVECVSYCVGQTAVLSAPTGLSGVTWTELGSQSTADSGQAVRKMWYARLSSNVTGAISVNGTESVGTFLGVQIAAIALTGTNTAPIGATLAVSNASPLINNLTTTAITTTAANSWVFAQGYESLASASGNPTSSDLTIVGTQNAIGNILGYKTVATSGTSTTTNLDAVGTGFTAWTYQVFEIKVAGGTAHTASATSTITATGTAAMSNARVGAGTGTGTATGTGAASRGQSVTSSASVTASATAAMSRTQAMSASTTGTASGTAAMSSTQAMSASATATGSGTAAMLKTLSASASGSITASGTTSFAGIFVVSGTGEVTATGTTTGSVASAQLASAASVINATGSVDFSITPPTTLQSNGTVIASGSSAMAKTMPYESTGAATAISQAGATHTYYIFKPPTREISPLSLDPYYQLVGYFQGRTLVKRNGVWKLVQNRQEDWLDQCEYVFKGGCENRVNGTQKAELESAGYTVETRTS